MAPCRLLLQANTPVTLAHDWHQVPAGDTYATLLFVQQAWPEPLNGELDTLFDDYVASGLVEVNRRFPLNHAAFGSQLPLEAALSRRNLPALRALFRAGCTTEKLGVSAYGEPMELSDYVRRAYRDSPGMEAFVAQALSAMMAGRIQAAAARAPAGRASPGVAPAPPRRRRASV